MPPTDLLDSATALAPAAAAAALRGRGERWVALLESGLSQEPGPDALEPLGRWSFLAARPLAVALCEPGQGLRLLEGEPAWGQGLDPDPLRAAAELIERARPAGWARDPDPAAPPWQGGATLTLSYDLGRRYERLPEQARRDADAPDLVLAIYGRVLAWDHQEGRLWEAGCGPGLRREDLAGIAPAPAPAGQPQPEPRVGEESLSRAAYCAAVERARGLIRQGDLFEVNLTRRHLLPALDAEATYAALRAISPAPFMADLELGAGRRLLSASPERFLSLDPQGRADSWPIKGTRPRGATPAEDAAFAEELWGSAKEAAELAMIVDLVRNDLGRVATPGTVRVRAPRLLQRWPRVHHTLGVVEAQLAPEHDWADLVRAAFPPGSVTGAPKVRALEVIEALEPVRRGLYCGAFGWVDFAGALDLAVAIRILFLEPTQASAHAGGAVLLKSEPAAEEREARTKAEALLRAAAPRGAARG